MTESDRPYFYRLLEIANELTIMPGDKKLSRLQEALFMKLKEYPLEVLAKALDDYCRAEKFFPMLADIIKQIEGTPDDRAALAWASVLKAKRKYKLRKGIRFSSPATHFALEKMGGWEKFYWSLDDSNEAIKAKDFFRLFKIGEKCASWNNEPGKIKVCPYFPSDEEIYARQNGKDFQSEVFNVETDTIIKT